MRRGRDKEGREVRRGENGFGRADEKPTDQPQGELRKLEGMRPWDWKQKLLVSKAARTCPALPWPEEFWSACVDFFTDGLCSKLQES